jgi:2-polyprenyl-6-methoxyphenol hydroxylase-like FAD-dependent oxidoreductase
LKQDAYDVLIIGGGLAGLALARQLLISSDKKILLVDRRELPPTRQKVGEATVQMSGYYYARVLQMEEHLLRRHYMKYNLRFLWRREGEGAQPDCYYDYHQSYIRKLSNIATYQLDRNAFEAELLRVNREHPNFTFEPSVRDLDVTLSEDGAGPDAPHTFRFADAAGAPVAGTADWVVDASGRGKFLKRRLGLERKSPVRHGTTFCWVDGLVDIEQLSPLSPKEQRIHPHRSALGHTPAFLATNHFCGEGFWFWTIPLHGITSLGLVYDNTLVPREEVGTPEKMIDWVCRRFPLFERDLRQRKIVDQSGFVDFAFDSAQTLSPRRWALCGEACRFADPLYSPGGDLISLYNTLICDAILTENRERLPEKVRLYEQLARSIYEAYLPSYAVSYETLGDQECFSLRYVWELSIYFGFYVFPFINDLFTDPTFAVGFLRRFSKLGPINRGLHHFLVGYYRWKKQRPLEPTTEPTYFEFMELGHLQAAEQCFYKVGVGSEEARRVLDEQLTNFEELARWIVAHVTAAVTGDPRAWSHDFVAGIAVDDITFDPTAMAEKLAACPKGGAPKVPADFAWTLAVPSGDRFRSPQPAQPPAKPPATIPAAELVGAAE